MNRRHFMQSFGAAASVAAIPTSLASITATTKSHDVDWSAGWKSVAETTFEPLPMHVEGKIPSDLSGTFLRNGPALRERAGLRVDHWFDGDGMLQRYVFNQGKIVHDGKVIETARFKEEQQAGRFLYQHGGTVTPNSRPPRNNDTTNQANIAVMPWNDELLALWEGGSAYRVNATTLDTIGRKDWGGDLQHMPFSAHPLIDKHPRIWNFGFAPYAGKTGLLLIYAMSMASGIEKVQPIPLPIAGYVHDFAQTEQHLVFLIPPYHYRHDKGNTYVSRFAWQPELGSKLLVIDKNDLSQQSWFDLPPGFVFHFGNAWQEKHTIGVHLCWYDDPSLMQSSLAQRIDDQHLPISKQAKITTVLANLNTGKAAYSHSDIVMEFPTFDDTAFSRDSELLGVGVIEKSGQRSDALTLFSPKTGRTQHYHYPDHIVSEEPLSVSTAQQKAKYVVQTFVDLKKQQTGLHVFIRDSLSKGPIATATMPRLTPLGFHGAFMKS